MRESSVLGRCADKVFSKKNYIVVEGEGKLCLTLDGNMSVEPYKLPCALHGLNEKRM